MSLRLAGPSPAWKNACSLVGALLLAACAPASESESESGETSTEAGPSETSTTDATTETGTTDTTDTTETGDPTPPDPVGCQADLDHVFAQDHVVELELNPAPGVWEATLEEWDLFRTKSYYEASLRFDDELVDSVGYRLKGWSSLAYGSGPGGLPIQGASQPQGKFPLKIDFDRFGGPRFHEVNKINLGNNWADLSYMRERLANRLYTAMGVPAPRTGYAWVSVDGHQNGLYTMVQQVDACFLEEHFGYGNGDGNLYKAVYTYTDIGALTWQGATKANYYSTTTCPTNFPDCGLVQVANENDPLQNDYADLIAFIDVLNHATDAEFEAEIQTVFDVDSFLRLAAVSVVTASFDGYLGMGHNYYLYHRPDTDRFTMIPWDQNESYAGHPCGQNALDFSVDQVVCNQRNHDFVLARRVFGVPAFRQQYLDYVAQLVADHFNEATHLAWIDEFDLLIRDYIEIDSNYIQNLTIYDRSLGYDPPSGPNLGGHGGIEYNLMYFVTERQSRVLMQL